MPLGLILNELVANSLEHAFPRGKGSITVEMRKLDGHIHLTVKDDGIGFDLKATESAMGFELIDTLIEQLGGTAKFESNEQGTTCRLHFPVLKG